MKRHRPNTVFQTARWVKMVFSGWLLGIVLILLLSGLLEAIGLKERQFYLGIGPGLGVGLLQWLELRKYGHLSGRWIIISALAPGIPFVLFDFFPSILPTHHISISVLVGGLLTGVLQRHLLVRTFDQVAGKWIWANAIGWPLAAGTVFLIDYTRLLTSNNLLLFILNLSLMLAGGLVLGLMTGMALRPIINSSLAADDPFAS